MKVAGGAGAILAAGLLLFAAGPGPGAEQPPARAPIVTTSYFALYSDFDTNLNDALIAAGLARSKGKPELFHSGVEAACHGGQPPSVRAAWDRAVDYYREIISPADWTAREQYSVRAHLAGLDDDPNDHQALQFVAIAESFRSAAAPAYRACRWAAQDMKNRRWIDELKSRLDADEKRIAAQLEKVYQDQWSDLPIPVDVVEVVSWSGANSIIGSNGGGHLLISTEYAGPSALEVVFHEASHLLMERGDPIRKNLDSAAGAAGFRQPGDLWHVVLFYSTGEVVRRILDEKGQPAYTPMLYGIFDRGSWVEYRSALEQSWRPYVDGGRTLPEAASGLMEQLQREEKPR